MGAYRVSSEFKLHKGIPRFVFLCGKELELNDNRNTIDLFYRKTRPDIVCFYAEKLWTSIEKIHKQDLLSYEQFLAEIADGIVLLVESYGSATELGAFAANDHLARKMLVFIDEQYKSHSSFINDGPARKLLTNNSESVVYGEVLNGTILSNHEVSAALRHFCTMKPCYINRNENKVKLKPFSVELMELITLLGPIRNRDLVQVYKYMKGFKSFTFATDDDKRLDVKVESVITFLESAGLLLQSDGVLRIANQRFAIRNFMFEMTDLQFSAYRSKLLARKYRKRAGIA